MLCEYFTKFIFNAVDIDIDDEIPMEKIKETILLENKDSDLLCMFCGADIWYFVFIIVDIFEFKSYCLLYKYLVLK